MNKEGKTIGGITFTGDITVNGPMFDIHDNQKVEIVTPGGLGERPGSGCTEEEAAGASGDDELVAQLRPIFNNNEADVRQFLKEIRGMAQEDITDLVNRWVKEKRISDYGNSRKGVLWGILNKAGLYTRSKTNWNGRVE